MDLPGTTLARTARMNESPRPPATPPTPALRAAPPPASVNDGGLPRSFGALPPPKPPVEEDPRRDDTPEELDKYDVSTLACTD